MHLTGYNEMVIRYAKLPTQLLPTALHMLLRIARIMSDIKTIVGRISIRAMAFGGEGDDTICHRIVPHRDSKFFTLHFPSICSACSLVFTCFPAKICSMIPSSLIIKVVRMVPMVFLPYIDFSPQAPIASNSS